MEVQSNVQEVMQTSTHNQDNIKLTKHVKLVKEYPPIYTGGAFTILKDEKHGFAMKDNKICVFNMETSQLVTIIEQENEEFLTFAISPNQQYLAVSNKNYLIRVFTMPADLSNLSQMECIRTFKTLGSMVLEMTFDPSSKFLAAGTADRAVKVYDVAKGFQTHNLLGHRGVIVKLMFYPEEDSLRLLSSAEDMQVKVWDLVMRAELTSLKGHSSLVTSFTFSNNKHTLITGSRDGGLALYNVKDNFKLITTLKIADCGHEEEEIYAAVYIYQGENPYVVIGGTSGQLSVLDISSQKICYVEKNVQGKHDTTQLIYLQKQNRIVSLNNDQILNVYDIVKQNKKKGLSLGLRKVESRCLYLDEIIDMKFITNGREEDGEEEETPSHALICSNSDTLKVMELETGKTQLHAGHTDIILCLDICKDFFLSGAKDNEIRLWKNLLDQAQGLKCLAVFKGHNQNVATIAFAPKKMNFFVSASQDNTIKIWDLQKFKNVEDDAQQAEVTSALMTVMGHKKYINAVKVSPNDKLVASASQDKTIKLWNASNLIQTMTLTGHKQGVWDISFSPVDKLLVSASGDKTVKVWNINNGTCIATLQGHQTSLVKVNWLNLGMQIASSSVDGVVKIWNLKKQACVNTFEMHQEKIWALDVKGSHIITGGGDSTVKIWEDCTVQKELEDKEKDMQRLVDEQKLSHLIREQDYVEAALMAFRLNKLRDFYLVMDRILTNKESQPDPVDLVLADKKKFLNSVDKSEPQYVAETTSLMTKVMTELMNEDKKRLLEIIRNLNAKHNFANLAQHLLTYVVPKFSPDEYLEEYKGNQGDLKDNIQVMEFYSQKHYERAERGLKKSFYVDFVLSQLTLQEDLEIEKKSHSKVREDNKPQKKVQIRDLKQTQSTLLNQKRKRKQRERRMSDNLFDEQIKSDPKLQTKRIKH